MRAYRRDRGRSLAPRGACQAPWFIFRTGPWVGLRMRFGLFVAAQRDAMRTLELLASEVLPHA